jgi:uncharacterized protein YlxW (UPF0749 family)
MTGSPHPDAARSGPGEDDVPARPGEDDGARPGTPAAGPEETAPRPGEGSPPQVEGEPSHGAPSPPDRNPGRARRRRNRLAAALIALLTVALGFGFAVQVRTNGSTDKLSTAREEDLVGLLDNLTGTEDRLRAQIADQQAALDQLTSSDSQSTAALAEARSRAAAIGILNGTVAAQGPGLRMVIRDPQGALRVADLLDAIEELRGAGAETMQVDGVRVGVDTAVTGNPGALRLDGTALQAPYEVLVIGSPQDLETAMNIPGGVVQRITGQGGSVDITQEQQVVVDALRPLQRPQYAAPKTGG